MSKPKNGAARNMMTKLERKCYDWGWEDAEERIIKVVEELMVINADHKFFVIQAIKGEQK